MDTDDRDALSPHSPRLYISPPMSLITRCPACTTMFKVVPDQLRVSEGWVRCGQCDEVFDASSHLVQVALEPNDPAGPQEELEARDGEPGSLAEAIIAHPVEAERVSGALDNPQESMLEQAQPVPDPESATHVPPAAQLPDPVIDTNASDLEPYFRDELGEVSFLRDRSNATVWGKPLTRVILVLASLLLVLVLAGQVVFHERDRILVMQPRLKPWLLTLCEHLNCTLSALRQIESIVIDSSSFTRIQGDSYRLSFTFKNTAATALAVPALELTLTDSLDQPVLRRVFSPTELGVPSDALSAGLEWPVSLIVAVKPNGGLDRVAGYRLLAFYP